MYAGVDKLSFVCLQGPVVAAAGGGGGQAESAAATIGKTLSLLGAPVIRAVGGTLILLAPSPSDMKSHIETERRFHQIT